MCTYIKNWSENKIANPHVIFIMRSDLVETIKTLFNIQENVIKENALCLISNKKIFKQIYPFRFYPLFILEEDIKTQIDEIPHKKSIVFVNYLNSINPLELLNLISHIY